MGSLDETLSAMLASDHGFPSSLATVMPSSNSGADLFASQYSSLQGSFPVQSGPKSSNFQRADRPSAPSQWPFSRDQKWVLDGKNEVMEACSPLASGRAGAGVKNFRPAMDAPGHLNPPAPQSGGLQRYHSAPSSFLQCLADFNEDAFSHISESSVLGDCEDAGLLDSFFVDNLAPISERGAQQMDTQKIDATTASSACLNDYEQFLVSQNTFSPSTQRRLTEQRSFSRPDHGHGGYSTPGISFLLFSGECP